MSRLPIVIFIIIATLGVSIGMQAQTFPLLAKTEIGPPIRIWEIWARQSFYHI